ncbi:MAG: hypothetical protein PHH14_06745 [Candidatus Margulisbacteria bacterium]|nr:hypothetical protein [Candidatus Margulisiibacteriota bacterium]
MTFLRVKLICALLMVFAGLFLFGCAGSTPSQSTYNISGKVVGATSVMIGLTGDAVKSTACDANGAFSFSSLVNGSYVVEPTRPGYDFSPAYRNVDLSNASSTDINFVANPTNLFSISGVVNGTIDAIVNLSGDTTGSVTVETDGFFAFNSLRNGNYSILPVRSGYDFSPVGRNVIISGESHYGDNFVATPVGTYAISGTVTGVDTVAMVLEGAASAATITNADGYYCFSGLSNGSYTVTPLEAGYTFNPSVRSITISGASSDGNNFTGSATSTYSISGTVLGADNVEVVLSGSASGTTYTNSFGFFSFDGLSNGTYSLTPAKTGYTFDPAARTVTISSESVAGNNFAGSLTNRYALSGYVLGTDGVTLNLTGKATATKTSGSGGYYVFDGLASGTYEVAPSKTGFIFTPASRSTEITTESIDGLVFSASSTATYSISGRVWEFLGLYGRANATLALTGPSSAVYTTEADGYFSFNDLSDGTYTINASITSRYFTLSPSSLTIVINGSSSTDNTFLTILK